MPAPFDRDGLFAIYNATYGIADPNSNTTLTDDVTATIHFHAVQQATAWLQGDVGYRGSSGDDEHYWSTYAVRALIVAPYMDYTNSAEDVAFLTTGSSASQFSRLIIPRAQVYGFVIIVTFALSWSAGLLTWSLKSGIVQPNNSLYPEIDFASKCVQSAPERLFSRIPGQTNSVELVRGLGGLLAPLSNGTTFEVTKKLKGINIHTGAMRKSPMDLPHVILTTQGNQVDDLIVGLKYS